jgi:hypothetical protein
MSRRVQIVLPDPVAAQLEELAARAGEPLSTLAGRMVRDAAAQATNDGGVRPLKTRSAPGRGRGGERAPWLEPFSGDRDWRHEMWGQIVALYGRYPFALEALQEGWWDHDSHVETLCALSLWRAQLDESGEDPREELFFQAQLSDYSRILRQEGGVGNAWRPGAPPEGWTGV